ncbi:MAG: hypothetical protein K6F71_05580 [Ruminococcus sp.]|uniref:hypothetical protein n=1 Tax=Ruminococcus sp. TaxID=41978 RepID=UPI0025E1AF3F|nr:hypothetical protein [Ruminococcus sp.]MCR5540282.1 hypothetical protein [Ruminococcus sp.]
MNIKTLAAVLALVMLAGCGNAADGNSDENSAVGLTVETPEQLAETDEVYVDDTYGSSRTAAFLAKIDSHDFALKLKSEQSGGIEVIEEVEVSGNVLHDIYKNTDGIVTAELYIVDGSIWSVTNEGSNNVTYQGFDNGYNDHVRECVFHCMTVGDADKYGGRTDGYTEKILGQTENMEYLFTYGDDGILKSYDVSGVHYEVLEYREGIGKLQLPENVRTAIENKDLYG